MRDKPRHNEGQRIAAGESSWQASNPLPLVALWSWKMMCGSEIQPVDIVGEERLRVVIQAHEAIDALAAWEWGVYVVLIRLALVGAEKGVGERHRGYDREDGLLPVAVSVCITDAKGYA